VGAAPQYAKFYNIYIMNVIIYVRGGAHKFTNPKGSQVAKNGEDWFKNYSVLNSINWCFKTRERGWV
jgi:hypothetical protein